MLPVGVLGDGLVAEVTIGDSLGPWFMFYCGLNMFINMFEIDL
jgi:hypothetical protein